MGHRHTEDFKQEAVRIALTSGAAVSDNAGDTARLSQMADTADEQPATR